MQSKYDIEYDVIIMGAGLAGVCQARHLGLKLPGAKVLLVDNKSSMRDDVNDYKVGESVVELPGIFLSKELDLQDYLLENHALKFGLQFHWAKDTKKTDTIADYHSLLTSQAPRVISYHLHRSFFERDVLRMVREIHGFEYLRGNVSISKLGNETTPHTLKVHLINEEGHATETIYLRAKHLIDAAGRSGVIGNKLNNLIKDPAEYFNVRNNAAWVRVKNFDPKTMDFGTYKPITTSSMYYTTNHLMGTGHWIWMIPLFGAEGNEISIGVVFQSGVISWDKLNTQEKLLSFFKNNHRFAYNVIESGEIVQFGKRPKIAYCSKRFISHDNWYVIGDAACLADPFYSTGLVMITFEVESNTAVIKSKLELHNKRLSENKSLTVYEPNDPDVMAVRDRVESANAIVRAICRTALHIVSHHDKHLGHASVMSWRIFLEATINFGLTIQAYIGKYHLCPVHAKLLAARLDQIRGFREDVYCHLDRLVEIDGFNMGMMNPYSGGLLVKNWQWSPTSSWDYSGILNLRKYEPKQLNLPQSIGWTFMALSLIYAEMHWYSLGLKSLLAPKTLINIAWLWSFSVNGHIRSWKHWWNQKPSLLDAYANEFKQYKFVKGLIPWEDSDEDHEDQSKDCSLPNMHGSWIPIEPIEPIQEPLE